MGRKKKAETEAKLTERARVREGVLFARLRMGRFGKEPRAR